MDNTAKQISVINEFLSDFCGQQVVEAQISPNQKKTEEVSFIVKFLDGTTRVIEVEYAPLRDAVMAAQAEQHQQRLPRSAPEQISQSITVLVGETYRRNARSILTALHDIDLEDDDSPESVQRLLQEQGFPVKVVYGPPMNVNGDWVGQLGVFNEAPGSEGAGVSFSFGALAGTYERAVELLSEAIRSAKV